MSDKKYFNAEAEETLGANNIIRSLNQKVQDLRYELENKDHELKLLQQQLFSIDKTKHQLENLKNQYNILEETLSNSEDEYKKNNNFLTEQLKQVNIN